MKAKLVACNVPTRNQDASLKFYQTLFGMEFARSLSDEVKSHHIPLSNIGQFLWISDRKADDEQISCVFAVDDLDGTIKELTAAGGKVFVAPFDAPIAAQALPIFEEGRGMAKGSAKASMGRFALLRDPDGSVFAIMQPTKQAESSFKTSAADKKLSPEVMAEHDKALKHGKAAFKR